MAKAEKTLGIDLGTTNSAMAVMEGGGPSSKLGLEALHVWTSGFDRSYAPRP